MSTAFQALRLRAGFSQDDSGFSQDDSEFSQHDSEIGQDVLGFRQDFSKVQTG
jgi:hypothetical protein